MENIAKQISDILKDYGNYEGFQFTPEHIIKWVSQFDEGDQQFLLEEFLHLLNNGIYIAEVTGRKMLMSAMNELAKLYKFKTVSEFLRNVHFLKLQPKEKSQATLLTILDEELKKLGFSLEECGKKSNKYEIYLDDILATGHTVEKDLGAWLRLKCEGSEKTNLETVIDGDKILIVSVFGLHTWAQEMIGWRLKGALKKDGIQYKILYRFDYLIENHPTKLNQVLNFAYPVAKQPKEVIEFLDRLPIGYEHEMKKKEYAFRADNKPRDEKFYSSPENRVRFENIILLKGTDLLNKVDKDNLNHNQRPLGNINPSFQTLGTGTVFFTWRNISNTTPIVFWWKVNWNYLFPVFNRGTKNK